ncbi:unnamed protein product [Thelazia callipaeda]|uniref:alpha-1,2-Mannosidase n=1 Tax=Thelazia callipaeda TaxID=103827 RepID=A0A0N5CW62_THECL|nr:unnamed protein product [Thelazia callipaeda]
MLHFCVIQLFLLLLLSPIWYYRLQVKEMFMHGYNSYMKFAYPHDELMPLSCKGRERGVTPPRGDVDDALGNFSLTLVDSLDSLVILDELDEFEKSVELIVKNVQFDSNLVVSVFETNIRMVGGLISGHVMAKLVQSRDENRLVWYKDELLQMASKLADKLIPAFNTTSGIPYSRINLKYGMLNYLRLQHDTCTACGGTMILEFAALSRLTGNPVYEEKARKAMDFLWAQRHRSSDLMGTVLNVHSGDWIRRDAGIGAGIDSYYEYCLKAYILLGDEGYLYRFNKHYDAIMKYINKGPLFIDVHMHKPTVAAKTYMDSLLAFWPGIQVLKGDLKAAIEFHEILYQVIKRHKFLPEAFTHDLQVHWAQHPIRPEFIESTYLLYRATKDEHYLRVAKNIVDSMNKYLRVECGYAAVKDIRSMTHEDRMDSFVLSETFKYLYMIFTDSSDLYVDVDNYILTTEAHFIPLSIGDLDNNEKFPRRLIIDPDEIIESELTEKFRSACPIVTKAENFENLPAYAEEIRHSVQDVVKELTRTVEKSNSCPRTTKTINARSFSATNAEHMQQLRQMGIQMQFQPDGHIYLSHSPDSGEANAFTTEINKLEAESDALNNFCILDDGDTTAGKNSKNVYILHQSHAALTQFLSLIMLVVLLWLTFVITAAVFVCIIACGYRLLLVKRPLSDQNSNPQCVEKVDNRDDCDSLSNSTDDSHIDDNSIDDYLQAISPEWAILGSEFIQEMIAITNSGKLGLFRFGTWVLTDCLSFFLFLGFSGEQIVQIISQPIFGTLHWRAAPAHFGDDLKRKPVIAGVQIAVPFRACAPLTNAPTMKGRIAVVQRHDCMFQEKARYAQQSGAVGIIIIDNTLGSSIDEFPPFAMSGDQSMEDDIFIPAVFLHNKEGLVFMEQIMRYPNSLIRLSNRLSNPFYLFEDFVLHGAMRYTLDNLEKNLEQIDQSNAVIVIDSSLPAVVLNFRFSEVSIESDIKQRQKVVEKNIEEMQKLYSFAAEFDTFQFYNVIRQISYWQLGLNLKPTEAEFNRFFVLLRTVVRKQQIMEEPTSLSGTITTVSCRFWDEHFDCQRIR